MVKLTKRKHKGLLLIIVIIVVFVLYKIYLNSPYTHVEEMKIINYALQGSRGNFKFKYFYYSDEKTIEYAIFAKYKSNEDEFFKIRNRMNEYLAKNPDYFLNDNYEISLNWIRYPNGGPLILSFTNRYSLNYQKDHPISIHKKYDSLDCLTVLYDNAYGYLLSDINDKSLYKDIKGLILEDRARIGDTEILKEFKSLEFFKPNNRITDDDLEKFKSMFPDCEIYGR